MTDQELMDIEIERLNKNLDIYESQVKAYKRALKQKSAEQGEQLAALAERLLAQIGHRNSDIELYGKKSFAANLNSHLIDAWVFAITNYGWHVKFDFRGGLISDLYIYNDDHRLMLHNNYLSGTKDVF